MQEILASLYTEGEAFSWLEIIGVLTALVYVALAAKSNRICFLFGLLSSLIYIYLATVSKFYFDSFINGYYVLMSVYGWFAWTSKKGLPTIRSLSKVEFIILITTGLCIAFILAFIAESYSDASLAYFDAFTTIFAIIATWMVVKRYLENWLIWIVVDFVAAGMYYYKELYLTSLLFAIYTIVAIFGFFKWKKSEYGT